MRAADAATPTVMPAIVADGRPIAESVAGGGALELVLAAGATLGNVGIGAMACPDTEVLRLEELEDIFEGSVLDIAESELWADPLDVGELTRAVRLGELAVLFRYGADDVDGAVEAVARICDSSFDMPVRIWATSSVASGNEAVPFIDVAVPSGIRISETKSLTRGGSADRVDVAKPPCDVLEVLVVEGNDPEAETARGLKVLEETNVGYRDAAEGIETEALENDERFSPKGDMEMADEA